MLRYLLFYFCSTSMLMIYHFQPTLPKQDHDHCLINTLVLVSVPRSLESIAIMKSNFPKCNYFYTIQPPIYDLKSKKNKKLKKIEYTHNIYDWKGNFIVMKDMILVLEIEVIQGHQRSKGQIFQIDTPTNLCCWKDLDVQMKSMELVKQNTLIFLPLQPPKNMISKPKKKMKKLKKLKYEMI